LERSCKLNQISQLGSCNGRSRGQ